MNQNKVDPIIETKPKDFFDLRAKPLVNQAQAKKEIIVLSDDLDESLDYDDDFENIKEQGSEKEIKSGKDNKKSIIQLNNKSNNLSKPNVNSKPVDTKTPLFQSKANFEIKKDEKAVLNKQEEKKNPENNLKIQKEERQGKALFITETKNNKLETNTKAKKAQSKPRENIHKKDLAKNSSANIRKDNQNNRRNKLRASVITKGDPEAIRVLTQENLSLVQQVIRLSQQIEEKMPNLRASTQSVISHTTSPIGERLKSKRELMEERTKKMKVMKKDIQNMYRILDNTYNIDEFIQKENKIKDQEKIINKQLMMLKDCKKMIRGQNKFFKEINKTNEQTGHIEDIENHYVEAKAKEKELREQYRNEDKKVKDQHSMIQMLRDRWRKIKYYVIEKKKQETDLGISPNVKQEEIDDVKSRVEELEQRRNLIIQDNDLQIQEINDEINVVVKVNEELNKVMKSKEDFQRIMNLKIKEFKRIMQGNYVNNVGKSRDSNKRENKPLFYTPAKGTTKIAPDTRSNSSRKTLDDTFKQDNKSEIESIVPSTKPYSNAPRNLLFNKSVKEENEDEYGSDFDDYNAGTFGSDNKTKDTATQALNNSNIRTETNNVIAMNQNNPEIYSVPQNKISSKPNFMIKRKL